MGRSKERPIAFMFRALLELLITILVVVVARIVLTSLLRSTATAFRNVSQTGSPPAANTTSNARPTGELHKDPVCGTYVAESTPFHQRLSGQTFYYCSEACREKHALVAR